MARTLSETINDRALKAFGQPVTKENFDKYADVWFKEANEFWKELSGEGLIRSADHVANLIKISKKHIDMTPEEAKERTT